MNILDYYNEREHRILEQRAKRIASLSQEKVDDDLVSALAVRVGRETYVIPVADLKAIYAKTTIVELPGVPSHIAGIVNIRGHVFPVFELSELLHVHQGLRSTSTALLLAEQKDVAIAFLIDEVGEVTNISENDIEPILIDSDFGRGKYLRGVLPDGRAVLDLKRIFHDESLYVNDTMI